MELAFSPAIFEKCSNIKFY